MSTRLSWGAVVGLVCLTAMMDSVPHRAQASIIENIFEQETTTQLGTISFPSIAGTSSAGVDLSYDLFTVADITSISWTLDPSDFDVLALSLDALRGGNPCNPSAAPCSNSTLQLTATEAFPGGTSCSGQLCELFIELIPIDFVAVVSTPEPASVALLTTGVLGVAAIRRRRSPHRAAHPANFGTRIRWWNF